MRKVVVMGKCTVAGCVGWLILIFDVDSNCEWFYWAMGGWIEVYFTSRVCGLCTPQLQRRAGRLVPRANAQTSSAYAVSSLTPGLREACREGVDKHATSSRGAGGSREARQRFPGAVIGWLWQFGYSDSNSRTITRLLKLNSVYACRGKSSQNPRALN